MAFLQGGPFFSLSAISGFLRRVFLNLSIRDQDSLGEPGSAASSRYVSRPAEINPRKDAAGGEEKEEEKERKRSVHVLLVVGPQMEWIEARPVSDYSCLGFGAAAIVFFYLYLLFMPHPQ